MNIFSRDLTNGNDSSPSATVLTGRRDPARSGRSTDIFIPPPPMTSQTVEGCYHPSRMWRSVHLSQINKRAVTTRHHVTDCHQFVDPLRIGCIRQSPENEKWEVENCMCVFGDTNSEVGYWRGPSWSILPLFLSQHLTEWCLWDKTTFELKIEHLDKYQQKMKGLWRSWRGVSSAGQRWNFLRFLRILCTKT